jgi:aminopeptidase N
VDDSAPRDGSTPDTSGPGGTSGIGFDALSYELVGRFDWTARRLLAKERVTLSRTSNNDVVELDADVDVKGVMSDDGTSLPFTFAPGVLRIDVSTLHADAAAAAVSFTINYEAGTSEALVGSASRDDDPVTARVVYTDSEPFFGMKWLPAIHKPSDRAVWKVELTVPANEDVVANGTRTKDDTQSGERVVRYESWNIAIARSDGSP